MEDGGTVDIEVIWRRERMHVAVVPESDVRELGSKLVDLTKVKPETMKLLVPLPTGKGSRLLTPFSREQPRLPLREAGVLEGKPIRMMGVSAGEIAEVSHDRLKSDLRIIGFDEEEERLKQRSFNRSNISLKLPQGPYIFCEFRTLELPGIKLDPPASEALKRMHMLACDSGIVAIMKKHRWRVGIMTELAPEGYVGISPKCILGFNKNRGEEISLRLRTDDLKGFRKYESIKKTLLHELAHMVHSEHDAHFFALDKQLNQEAESLDWTKTRGHTLAGRKVLGQHEDEGVIESSDYQTGRKLGGAVQSMPTSARAASAVAAYNRLQRSKADSSVPSMQWATVHAYEHTASAVPYDSVVEIGNRGEDAEPDPDDSLPLSKDDMLIDLPTRLSKTDMDIEHDSYVRTSEPDPDDCLDDLCNFAAEPVPDDFLVADEPDPDDLESKYDWIGRDDKVEPISDYSGISTDGLHVKHHSGQSQEEPDPDECSNDDIRGRGETASDVFHHSGTPSLESDPDGSVNLAENKVLDLIEEPATIICNRLQMAIKSLRTEAAPGDATSSLQTLFKIIRNVLDHPNDVKFQKLRKENPSFQKNVARYKAAMELLAVVGFCEDTSVDELGRSVVYMVLKRNDPGLLWLAKSSLEVSIA